MLRVLALLAQQKKLESLPVMHEVVDRVSRHSSVLAAQADRYLYTFEHNMPWAGVHEEGRPRLMGPVREGEARIGQFVVLPESCRKDRRHAVWYPTLRDMAVFPNFEPGHWLAVVVLFHELFHVHDERTFETEYQKAASDGSYPVETDAWDFESQLLNSLVGGRFYEEVHKVAGEIVGKKRKFLGSGIALVPELDSSFLRLFGPKPPPFCVDVLIGQFKYELAKELLLLGYGKGKTPLPTLAQLYTYLQNAPDSKLVDRRDYRFVVKFVDRW